MSVYVVLDGAFEAPWTGVNGAERCSDSHLVLEEGNTGHGKRLLHKLTKENKKQIPMITPIEMLL